ncbi:MAG: biotin--[acetyl-CoA-carboxylase] ligase [Clostridia bacterium]|nr:biotin--[acetyl-CoA-carboxylase] ligase [Clostridia bacterium]
MLDVNKIKTVLGKKAPKIIYYQETDSTNTRAKLYAKEHTESREPVIFIADSQTAGRGRLGRSFCSKAEAGIYISFLLYPKCVGALITKFTPFAAVKLAECVEEATNIEPQIKWVNDLYASGKKLAGILVEGEMNSEGKIAYLVCGLGINVYKTSLPDEISSIAISLEEASGERISREELAALLINKILSSFEDFDSDGVFSGYKKRLNTLGKEVNVIKPDTSYPATVKALNSDYSLTLTLPDGNEEILFTGEVSVRRKLQ